MLYCYAINKYTTIEGQDCSFLSLIRENCRKILLDRGTIFNLVKKNCKNDLKCSSLNTCNVVTIHSGSNLINLGESHSQYICYTDETYVYFVPRYSWSSVVYIVDLKELVKEKNVIITEYEEPETTEFLTDKIIKELKSIEIIPDTQIGIYF